MLLAHCRPAAKPEPSLTYDLAAGDFLRVVVEQLGADVALELQDPEGELMVRVDSPNGTQGVEELVAIATRPGRYRLDLVFTAVPGASSYRLAEVERRPATFADRALVDADREYREGRARLRKGQPVEAAEKFRLASRTFERLSVPARQAAATYGLYTAYEAMSELRVAAALCDRAIELYRRQPDRLLLAVALRSASYTRVQLGQPERAVGPLVEARELHEAVGDREGVALSLGYLGTAYQAQGRLQQALHAFEQALERGPAVKDPASRATIHSDAAGLFLTLNRPQEALDQADQALALLRQTGPPTSVAIALRSVGRAALQIGDLGRGLRSVEEAVSLVPPGADAGTRAAMLVSLGSVLRQRGELDRGRKALVEALELARSTQALERQATALLELGYLEVVAHEPRLGLELLDQAFVKFAAIPDVKGQASARVRGAEALRDLGRVEEAWERLQPALEVIEGLRTATERRSYRSSYFAFRQDYYGIGVDLLMRLEDRHPGKGYAQMAFAVHERRLARELLDARSLAGEEADPEVEDSLSRQQAEVEARLRVLALERPDPANERELRAVLGRLDQVRAAAEGVARSAGAPVDRPLELNEIQRTLLDQDSILLSFSLGEERSFLWVVSDRELRAYALPPKLEIEAVARGFVEATRSRRQGQAELRQRLGRRLIAMLLAPAAAELGPRRLVVIPQGILQAIPWAALPDPASSGQHRYLVEAHEIVLLPSAATLAAVRRSAKPRRHGTAALAVFADPVYQPDDPQIVVDAASDEAAVTRERRATPWPPLPFSRTEAERVLATAEGPGHRLSLGFDATRQALEATEWNRFGAVHFAVHAEVHPQHPELSGLVLSLFDRQGRPQDGFLRAFEIARLRMPVDLVVLSACETGVGEDLAGEGMASLSRAFFEAGARSVVSSLWRVSDRSTAELMARFYEAYYRRGRAPAAALREAQRALLAEQKTEAPFFWAGFVLQGDWR